MWGIAIEYKTTIEQIKRLNNLTDDIVIPGWKLLVKKGATQPVPARATFLLNAQNRTATPIPTWTMSPTSTARPNEMSVFGQSLVENKLVVAALIVSLSALVGAIVGFGKK